MKKIVRVCGICGETFKNNILLKKHVIATHSITVDEYLRKYHFGCEVGKCKNCGKAAKYSIYNFAKYCSSSCQLNYRYARETPAEKEARSKKIALGWTKEKRQQQSQKHKVLNKKYDSDYYAQRDKKLRKTKEEKYGDAHYGDFGSERNKEAMLEKYGVENIFQLDGFYDKYCENVVAEVRKTCRERYNTDWIPHEERDNNIPKRIETCRKRYGVDHYVQSKEYQKVASGIQARIRATKRKNGSTNTSALETNLYKEVRELYPTYEVQRDYTDKRYPYNCDIYVKELDLFIEIQGYFTHGKKAFLKTKEDNELLVKWLKKAEDSKFFKNAVYNWTVRDVEKRELAKINQLNFLEVFSFEDIELQIDRVVHGLTLVYTNEELEKELMAFVKGKPSLSKIPNTNKVIKEMQQEYIFHTENKIYKEDSTARRKLIQNRCKYLDKKEGTLTNRELLSGFKISGLYRGYSMFSPYWAKYFYTEYKPKIVLDPFGGWGHRMLGLLGTEVIKYIYNDIDTFVQQNCEAIYTKHKDFFKSECVFYNKDILTLEVSEKYDSIFTCPPYDNLEEYKHTNQSYEDILKSLCNLFTEDVKQMGVVIREDYYHIIKDTIGNAKEVLPINTKVDHFGTKKYKENLYIWQR